ncbi:MAG: membrane protein insertase YidC [Prevotella sp.]|nr:membrane protein insertase YidC [Prevotella sp.]MBR7049058.1 membrane protein insertase YidC [Prevotella sp.]
MDKNTVLGFVLIAAILIGYGWWAQPSDEQIAQQREQFVKDSIAAVNKQKETAKKQAAAQKAKETAMTDSTALFHTAMSGNAQDIQLKNQKLSLTISTQGGTVKKVILNGYTGHNITQKGKGEESKDLLLFDGNDQQLAYTLVAKNQNISTKDLFFTPTNVTDSTVTLTAEAGEGKTLVMNYRLGKDYMLHMDMRATGMAGLFDPNTKQMSVNWNGMCRQQEMGYTFESRYATLTYKEKDGSTDHLSETSETRDEVIEDALDWVAFKDQFFTSIMIAKTDFASNAMMTSIPQAKDSGYLKEYQANLKTFFDPSGQQPTEFEFYYGPNDFQILKNVEEESTFGKELELQKLVYLGWPIVRWINRFFTIYVFDWLSKVFPMGIVLILITLLLKAITFPLVKKSYMSSAKMRVLKPKLEEATKQYDKPEDQMKKQQEMMQLYSKYGVSPLSGCLPMLIQMPIWIAMFNFVPNAIQLRGEKFLWMDDLSTYDPIFQWNSNLPLIGDHLSLTCVLFCVSNLLYSWMTMRQQRDQMVGQQAQQMKMMQWMMFLMPVMFFFMFNDYSSGLNFYYFISLFFSAAIMWTLRKTTNDEKLLQILEARYQENKNNPKKMSGLAARLQAMQEQQAEMQRKREELQRKRKGLGK